MKTADTLRSAKTACGCLAVPIFPSRLFSPEHRVFSRAFSRLSCRASTPKERERRPAFPLPYFQCAYTSGPWKTTVGLVSGVYLLMFFSCVKDWLRAAGWETAFSEVLLTPFLWHIAPDRSLGMTLQPVTPSHRIPEPLPIIHQLFVQNVD